MPRSAEEQEKAVDAYVNTMIARDRAAKAADAQAQGQAQGAVAKDDAKLQQDTKEVRRQRQGYTLR